MTRTVCHFAALATLFAGLLNAQLHAQESHQADLYNYLRTRTETRPHDASAWRMLGSYALQRGDLANARQALNRAVSLDSTSAAAHFDLAQCLLKLGEDQEAARHFQEASVLAPGSDYANQSKSHLADLPSPPQIMQVGYEIKRLDGSNLTRDLTESAQVADSPPPFFVKIDIGATYNSNVTLTPISRDFGAPEQESAQGFINPYLEYRVINNAFWSAGPTFTGYFSMNENDALRTLNLQSYQPGFFVERTICCSNTILVPKLQYDYTLDQFDGLTFGNRHAATASLTSLWDRGDTSVVYFATNHTNFSDDGADPATSSRDGWLFSSGASHTWPIGMRFLGSLTAGADVEWANVQGTDFAYFGGTVYAGVEIPLTDTLWCELEAGIGMRDYYDSTITPSRNETPWRGSAKITKQLSRRWLLSGVFNYDRFASDNALFEAERYVAGLVTTFQY